MCTNGFDTNEATGQVVTQDYDCTGSFPVSNVYPNPYIVPGTSLSNIVFDFDPSATEDYHVTAQFPGAYGQALYDSSTNTFDWDSHFSNSKTINCPIHTCWLSDLAGVEILTTPIYMDSNKLIYAKHQTGGAYAEYYRVYC